MLSTFCFVLRLFFVLYSHIILTIIIIIFLLHFYNQEVHSIQLCYRPLFISINWQIFVNGCDLFELLSFESTCYRLSSPISFANSQICISFNIRLITEKKNWYVRYDQARCRLLEKKRKLNYIYVSKDWIDRVFETFR